MLQNVYRDGIRNWKIIYGQFCKLKYYPRNNEKIGNQILNEYIRVYKSTGWTYSKKKFSLFFIIIAVLY